MFSKLLQTLRCALPAACIVCQQASGRDYSLCEDCELALPKLGECCQRCGVELKGRLSYESLCSSCLLSASTFDSCRAAFPYASPIKKLVGSFKFSARFDIGYSLSRVLSKAFNTHYSGTGKPQLLLPVSCIQSDYEPGGSIRAMKFAGCFRATAGSPPPIRF